MAPSTPTPSLLLTKRLTAFLSSNLSPQIHTAVLTTLSGKLLSHASPHSVGTLRTQCTVAASIWALYSTPAASETVAEALPTSSSSSSTATHTAPAPAPSAVTIQLTGGIMVIRYLRCGLLFVCIGPAGEGTDPNPNTQAPGRPVPAPQGAGEPHASTPLGSPSEVESVTSVGAATTASIATTASVAASAAVATRRQAEELARWLDDKLGSLGVLEENIGIETR
ncbi:hypothetical protein GGR54DRAFT_366796 [Hypoxylon sp. NC1633]|nr:hypothetical protein GGR54DRAFT_366796 [Hypoxylon sp. NC1633]